MEADLDVDIDDGVDEIWPMIDSNLEDLITQI